jgi:hypothetical protein
MGLKYLNDLVPISEQNEHVPSDRTLLVTVSYMIEPLFDTEEPFEHISSFDLDKEILSRESGYFRGLLSGNMRESSESGVIIRLEGRLTYDGFLMGLHAMYGVLNEESKKTCLLDGRV